MSDWFEQGKQKLKKQATSSILKKYKGYNEDGRKWAREELRKRKVPESTLIKHGIARKKSTKPKYLWQ